MLDRRRTFRSQTGQRSMRRRLEKQGCPGSRPQLRGKAAPPSTSRAHRSALRRSTQTVRSSGSLARSTSCTVVERPFDPCTIRSIRSAVAASKRGRCTVDAVDAKVCSRRTSCMLVGRCAEWQRAVAWPAMAVGPKPVRTPNTGPVDLFGGLFCSEQPWSTRAPPVLTAN